jgi:hypothetical protein
METQILENKLNETRDTLIELERLKTDIRFISNKEAKYFSEIIEKSAFFYRIYRNSIKLFVIDICKLMNSNEDFSLLKTLNFIQSNRKRIVWKKELKADRINELILKIEILNSEHLESFKNLRDKHYAHNDKKKFNLEYNVTLKKCWETLFRIQEIFIELSLCLTNEQYIFSILTTEPNEIISLLKYKKIKETLMTELKKGPDLGKLQMVRDITLGKKPA